MMNDGTTQHSYLLFQSGDFGVWDLREKQMEGMSFFFSA